MMVVLQLGSVTLQGFEVPGRVQLGGAQSLAVHKLPGGVRVIDVMGRDDGDIAWAGVISGANASGRAAMLDAMRAAGDVLPLTWDQFFYSVIIADLQLAYTSPWWIEYRITCKVLLDEAQASASVVLSAGSEIAGDLASASLYVDVTAALAAVAAAGALTSGTAAAAAAASSLSAVQGSISQGVSSAETGLMSSDLATAVSASGTLAQLCVAQDYVGRAVSNLAEAG
jgi:hypothetical protein